MNLGAFVTMGKLSKQVWKPIVLALALLLVAAGTYATARPDQPTSTLKFQVLRGENEKPIENASIYVEFVEQRTLRPDKHVQWRAKSNREGLAVMKDVPRGKVLIQVVASGWKTYGKYHDITQNEQTITIKLERPRRWY